MSSTDKRIVQTLARRVFKVDPFSQMTSTGLAQFAGGSVTATDNAVGYITANKSTGAVAYTSSSGTSGLLYLARVQCLSGEGKIVDYFENAPYDVDGASSSGSGELPSVTVAYAASITPDISAYSIFNVGTLTGNIAINAPTGTPTDNTKLLFRFVQNGTGGWTYTWNSAFAFGTDVVAADLPTTASAKFEVFFRYNTIDSKYRCTGLIRGF
jgi:hypothetical protein